MEQIKKERKEKMRNLMIIVTVAFTVTALAATASAIQPVQVQIPVYMNIVPVASIDLNGAQILLERIPGSTDYEGDTDPDNPILTCNVPVNVGAQTVAQLPSVSLNWYTAFFMDLWSAPNGTAVILVSPDVTPLPLVIRVKAEDVDMSQRPNGLGLVAITTVTVTPI